MVTGSWASISEHHPGRASTPIRRCRSRKLYAHILRIHLWKRRAFRFSLPDKPRQSSLSSNVTFSAEGSFKYSRPKEALWTRRLLRLSLSSPQAAWLPRPTPANLISATERGIRPLQALAQRILEALVAEGVARPDCRTSRLQPASTARGLAHERASVTTSFLRRPQVVVTAPSAHAARTFEESLPPNLSSPQQEASWNPFLRAADVAKLSRPPSTVYDLVRRGILPHVRMPGREAPLIRFYPGRYREAHSRANPA